MRHWLIGATVVAMAMIACGRSGVDSGADGGPNPTPTGSSTATGTPTPIGNGDGLDGDLTVSTAVTVNTCALLVSASGTSATVSDAAPFVPGRAVVVHQVQDDLMAAYGSVANVTNLQDAGRAEIARISSVAASTLTLSTPLAGVYTTTGASRRAQACTVPQYGNVTIDASGAIVPPNLWEAQTGGIVVFLVQGTLALAGRVNVGGGGFRGGPAADGGGATTDLDGDSDTSLGAFKGEGLDAQSWTRKARGNLASGAGGGNDDDAGGGGGANGGVGGRGGNGSSNDRFGIGGARIVSNEGLRLLFGGGGGGGEQDGGAGTAGGRGGGAILIRANVVTGGGLLDADGANASSAASDGAGGGGAGGTVVLIATDATAFTGELAAEGGDGGDSNGGSPGGPGGGGGGGRIHAPAMPGAVVTSRAPGDNGTANNDARNSTPGQAGVLVP